jgi:pimeloyl-ACP methyl ester carboxylesterase
MSAVPIVFVHGGGHGAWCWEPTLALLDGPTIAVDLPPVSIRGGPGRNEFPDGMGELTLTDWADAVLAAADAAGFDHFVLVGHSLAGLTISEVARRAPARVARLVYVSAMVPRQGENAVDAMAAETMARVSGGLTEAIIVDMFCNDMDAEQTQFVLDHVGNEAAQIMGEPVDRDGIPPELPKTYIRLSRDHALTPDAQARSIAALEAVPGGTVDVIEIDSAHNVMISHPAELVAMIVELQDSTRNTR